jgi:hypothetical protein
MLLNITKSMCLGALVNVRINGNRSLCSFFNANGRVNSSTTGISTAESLQRSLLLPPLNLYNSLLYNNRLVRSIASSSSQSSGDGSNSGQSSSSPSSELSIEHHLNEGIVEVQLNRPQGKNSLSKRLLSEVRQFSSVAFSCFQTDFKTKPFLTLF